MKTGIEEAYSKRKIFDMLASMHFKLRDNYNRWNTIFDSIEILFSVLLCGITFLDFETYFNIKNTKTTVVIGFISIALFAFTLVKQKLNYKSKAEKHKLAGKMYSSAKIDLSQKIILWENCEKCDNQMIIDYLNKTFKNLNDLEQVPENKFHKYKHYHLCKIEFSKFLDNNKTIPWFMCKLRFYISNIRK